MSFGQVVPEISKDRSAELSDCFTLKMEAPLSRSQIATGDKIECVKKCRLTEISRDKQNREIQNRKRNETDQ